MQRLVTLSLILFMLLAVPFLAQADSLDNHLNGKWETMAGYLKQGNTEGALSLIHPHVRKKYAEMFQALKGQLPRIASTEIELKRKEVGDRYAKYELATKEGGKLYSYDVIFVKDDNGTWWIRPQATSHGFALS